MKNILLQSFIALCVGANANYQCLASSEASTQSSSDSSTQSSSQASNQPTSESSTQSSSEASNQSSSEASSESQSESGLVRVAPSGTAPQINSAIQNDTHLSPEAKNDINITNKDGTIVITGTVPKDSDRERINALVEQSGAPSVRNELKVANSGQAKNKVSTQGTVIIPKYNR